MKRHIKTLILGFFSIISFASCKNDSLLKDEPTNQQLIQLMDEGKISGIRLPENAIIEKNGEKGFTVSLPSNFKFVFQTEQGLEYDPISTITCRCSEGSGCNPVRIMGRVGCAMQPSCRSCQLTGGRLGDNIQGKFLGIVQSDAAFGFVTTRKINKDDYFDGLLEVEEKDVLGQAQEWLFELDDVKNMLMDVYSLIYEEKIPEFILQNTEIPSDHVYAKASIMGNTFAMPIPKDMIVEGMQVMDPIAGEIKCRCLTGQSGCQKTSKFGAIICKADDCVSCQMIY